MKSVASWVFTAIFVGLAGSSAFAAGDPVEGQKLAKEHCSDCHDVEAGGKFKQYPPSFAAIAVYRSEAHMRALVVYPALHNAMPQVPLYLLDDDKLDDLVAYIQSLEEEGAN